MTVAAFGTYARRMTALERAIAIAGSQARLADLIGVHQTTVFAWLHGDGRGRKKGEPPAAFVPRIVEAVGGEIKKSELRPDIFLETNA